MQKEEGDKAGAISHFTAHSQIYRTKGLRLTSAANLNEGGSILYLYFDTDPAKPDLLVN